MLFYHQAIIVLILLATIITMAQCRKRQSIFLRGKNKNYCQLKCGQEEHTLCQKPVINKKKCGDDFREYPTDAEFKTTMLQGHNGIRHKIAGSMNVGNMRVVRWDTELATMARYWLRRCELYEKDPCTQLYKAVPENLEAEEDVDDDSEAYTMVDQNFKTKKSLYFPYQFPASTIRTWYFEKNKTPKPVYIKKPNGLTRAYFNVTNNFTHISFARMYRIGCAMIRSKNVYSVVCNYYPYETDAYSFIYAKPAKRCPNKFPIGDLMYTNLCTDRGSSVFIAGKFFKLLTTCLLMLLTFCVMS